MASTVQSTLPVGQAKNGSGQDMASEEADSLLPAGPTSMTHLDVAAYYPVGNARRARLAMYASHFLSTWGQRAWEFLVGLVMLEIHPSSLLLVSLFGLCDAATVVLLGPAIGAFIDRTERLKAASTMYIVQNSAVALSAAACLALVVRSKNVEESNPHDAVYWSLVACAIALGSISSLGATGATMSVEREWTKTLNGDDSQALSSMNAVMKRIDLTCLIASPIGVGLLMGWRSDAAVAAVLAWNMAAWLPECALLRRAQAASPALAAPKIVNQPRIEKATSHQGGLPARVLHAFAGIPAYWAQPAAAAAFALALLYFTVLSFGTLMTAYLKWTGLGETELAIYRGFGAVSGIAATLVFSPLAQKLGLVRSGAGALWMQLLCLAGGATPLVVFALGGHANPPPGALTRVLVVGLVLSRFGLWGFDLAVNQIIQETVDADKLGAVSGVQGSLQSLFQTMSYAAGVVVWQPQRFVFLIAGSVGVVTSAAVLFSAYALREGCSHIRSHSTIPSPLTP